MLCSNILILLSSNNTASFVNASKFKKINENEDSFEGQGALDFVRVLVLWLLSCCLKAVVYNVFL